MQRSLTPQSRSLRLLLGPLVLAGVLGAVAASGAFASDADPDRRSPPSTVADPGGDEHADDGDHDAPLVDGRHLGTIDGAYVAPAEIAFDVAELFVGDDARREALADGVEPSEVGDFYLRDDSDGTVSLAVADDVVVTVVDCSGAGCVEGAPSDYDSFTVDRDEGSYFWITVDGGVVVRIEQLYLP